MHSAFQNQGVELRLGFKRSKKIKYGRWSDNLLIKIPEVEGTQSRVSLYRKLSIIVQFLSENLVGSVICGKKLSYK